MFKQKVKTLYLLKIVFFLIGIISSLFAQSPVVITDELEAISMNDWLVYYEDETGIMSLQDIQSIADNKFQSLQGRVNIGFSQSSFWVRIKFQNKKIQAGHPLWILRANNPEIDYIDYFQLSEEGSLITSYKTGNMREVGSRQRPDENLVFLVTIPRNQTHTIYLLVKSETPLAFDFSILAMDQYLKVDHRTTLFSGIFIGILLLAIGYYSTLYFRTKDLSFLYLVFAGIALLFNFLASSQYGYIHLWPDATYWNKISVSIFGAIMVAFFIKFISEFLELKKYMKNWYRIFDGLFYSFVILAIFVSFFNFFIISQINNLLKALTLILIIPVSFNSFRRGYKPAKFFFIGVLLISPAGLYHLIMEIGLLPSNIFGNIGYRIGSVFFIWFFSQAVSDRMNLLKSQKEKVERDLHRSENRFHRLFNSASDAFLIMKDDIFIDCNEKALEVFDCTRSQLVGEPPYKFSPATQPDGMDSQVKAREKLKAALTGEAQFFEWKHFTPAGRPFDAEVKLNTIHLKTGLHIQAIVRDITARKRTEYLMNVLREAGNAMQDALTSDEVFNRVSETLRKYDFHFTYFSYNEEDAFLEPGFLSYSEERIKQAEKVAAIKLEDLKLHKKSAKEFTRVIENHEVLFVEESAELLEKMLPKPANQYAKKINAIIDIPSLILAPVVADNRIEGIISVQSEELQESDVPAISIFVQQFSNALNRAQHFEQVQTEISIRELAEKALKNSEEYFRSIIENSKDVVVIIDNSGQIVYESPSHEREFGYPTGHLLGKKVFEQIYPEDKSRIKEQLEILKLANGHMEVTHFRHQHYDGSWHYIDGSMTNLLHLPSVEGIVINFRDVTESQQLQEQLTQAQKMEAIGQLAGGVAHDFNNLLTIISGYSHLLLINDQFPAEHRAKIEEIEDASSRAGALTRQLLAFSRKQIVQPKIVDINNIIKDSLKMLRRLIGEDIQIKLNLSESLSPVLADPHQLEQILINLIVNARDAVQSNNKSALKKIIIIETKSTFLDATYIKNHTGSHEGSNVGLVISDTGIGMDKKTIKKIFEPFFTTKEESKGTGLGLSTVYGIVKQNNAYINVYSEPGMGTSFKIYWPQAEKKINSDGTQMESKIIKGNERVLIVEDDGGVRSFCEKALTSMGYNVYQAENGNDAIDLIKKKKLDVDLVLTDIIMPGMDGKKLSLKIKKLLPKTKIIFTSGYTDNHIVTKGFLKKGVHFLEKPYSISSLSQKIRQVLDNA